MVNLGPVAPICLHDDAVSVATLDGEHVAWLCPDCDEQLPTGWVSPAMRREAIVRDHEKRHHGHPRIIRYECPRCAEELGWKI